MTRVLLVYDHPAWCFSHMARGIQRYAPPEYDVRICCSDEFSKNAPNGADAVCQFSWTEASWPIDCHNVTILAHPGCLYLHGTTDGVGRFCTTNMRNQHNAMKSLPNFDAVLCFNRELHDFARVINPNAHLCFPGVDTDVFRERPPASGDKLKVLWCGQKPSDGKTNQKGYHEILRHLMKHFGDRFDWRINTRTAAEALTPAQMWGLYQECDVFLCTSVAEGGPLPVLEAMATGRPVVSTPVGVVPEAVQTGHNGILTSGVEVSQLIGALELMDRDPEARKRMGHNARKTIEERFSWTVLSEAWLTAITTPPPESTSTNSESESPESR